MIEEWRDIAGYEGYYQVSNFGRVKSLDRIIGPGNRSYKGRILIQDKSNKGGYCRVYLSKNGIRKAWLVHRLVAIAFIPNPNNLSEVNHKDEDPANNIYTNLEWCDGKYNSNYGTRTQKIINKVNKRQVEQYDLNGKLINTFDSINEAGRLTNIPNQNIWKVCNGLYKTAGGFIWKYKN